jgi:dihydroneopterin aldolase
MDDRIFLRGLTAECIIGFIDWERKTPQTVVVDLEFSCDARHAARTDLVADTVAYQHVARRTREWVTASKFNLVETLAHELALVLLREFALQWVRVSVSKPGALRHAREVGVIIERHRTDLPAA